MTLPPNRPERDTDWIDRALDDLAAMPVPDASGDLMARVLGDAEALMPPPGGVQAVRIPLWRQIVQGLGGWTAVGGLVAAAATGFVVGLGGFDTTGTDTIWSLGYGTFYEGEGALAAFGWDFEEG